MARLEEVLTWARERSPFYSRLYDHLTVPEATSTRHRPGVRGQLPGLTDLPFVQQADFREHGLDMVCVPLGDITRVVTVPTSGSQGPPKRVWFTEEDLELTVDHFRYGMRALVSPGQRVLVLMPGSTPGSVGWLLRDALARDGVEVESYGLVDDCCRVADRIDQYGADCLVGLPGQLLRLARSEAGRALPPGRIKAVLTSGDHVARSMRNAIEQGLGCRVFEHYGSTEIGLGGAVQCEALAWLHVREADLLFEVVDPRTSEPLPDGQEGELVITTLTRRGMPFIRFRTGDAARMAPGRCECGSVLRCVASVKGRFEGSIDVDGGASLGMGELDAQLFTEDWLMAFTAEVTDGPRGDGLVILAEARQAPSASALAALRKKIENIHGVHRAALAVDIHILPAGPTSAGDPFGQAKRTIRDTRKRVPAGVEPPRPLASTSTGRRGDRP